jgi:single-stranded DNA-binding protein
MALEVSGKLVKIMPQQTGAGKNGNWVKQEFIIETSEQYPKKICISAWGDKVEELSRLEMGDEVRVAVNIESREYNDRWYTDVRAWKIETGSAGNSNNNSGNRSGSNNSNRPPADDFGAEPYNSGSSNTSSTDDDLPF